MTNSRKLNIIIIDDDPAINLLLQTALSKLGHNIMAFTDPAVCLLTQNTCRGCTQESPCADVIISDIVMPNINGIDLFKLQREKGCKTLAENQALISASTDPAHVDAAEELGCKFFRKPFKLVDIITWLGECAERVSAEKVLTKPG